MTAQTLSSGPAPAPARAHARDALLAVAVAVVVSLLVDLLLAVVRGGAEPAGSPSAELLPPLPAGAHQPGVHTAAEAASLVLPQQRPPAPERPRRDRP